MTEPNPNSSWRSPSLSSPASPSKHMLSPRSPRGASSPSVGNPSTSTSTPTSPSTPGARPAPPPRTPVGVQGSSSMPMERPTPPPRSPRLFKTGVTPTAAPVESTTIGKHQPPVRSISLQLTHIQKSRSNETFDSSSSAVLQSISSPSVAKDVGMANPETPKAKPCVGLPASDYAPILEVFCELQNSEQKLFQKAEDGTWKTPFAPSCTGLSDGKDGRCAQCRGIVTKADRLLRKRVSKKRVKPKATPPNSGEAAEPRERGRRHTISKGAKTPTKKRAVPPSKPGQVSSDGKQQRRRRRKPGAGTDWSNLALEENLKCKESCFKTLRNVLQALQLNPYEVQEIIGTVERKSKYTQLNLFLAKDTFALLETVWIETHLFLDVQRLLRSLVIVQSKVRSWLCRRRFLAMREVFINSELAKRNKIFRELVKKEGIYTNNLDVVINDFLIPLREAEKKKKGILSEEEISSIFINLESIRDVHKALYSDLLQLQENWPDVDGIGMVFLKRAASFSAYGKYTLLFKTADEVLATVRQREKTAHFFDQKMVKCGMEIQMLLSLPLNMISDYRLTMERLLQSTPPDSPDYVTLDQAYLLMKTTSQFLHTCLEKAENQARIFTVNQRIKKSPAFSLDDGVERIWVREGKVYVESPKNKKYKGFAFLFQNELVLCKYSPKPPYQLAERFPLANAHLEDSKQQYSSSKKACFDLVNEDTRLTLAWKDIVDIKPWMEAIESQVALHQKHRVFGVELAKAADVDPTLKIPSVIVLLVNHIRQHAPATEGIFRVNGHQQEIDSLKDLIDKGQATPEILKDFSPLAIGAVLKLYLRLLPEPLLTFNLYEPLLAAQSKHQDDALALVAELKVLLKKLPTLNYKVLEFLMEFLLDISQHSEKNMMKASNLAICFSPNLLHPKVETIDFTLNITKVNAVVEALIDRFGEIFRNEAPKEVKPAPEYHKSSWIGSKSTLRVDQMLRPQGSLPLFRQFSIRTEGAPLGAVGGTTNNSSGTTTNTTTTDDGDDEGEEWEEEEYDEWEEEEFEGEGEEEEEGNEH